MCQFVNKMPKIKENQHIGKLAHLQMITYPTTTWCLANLHQSDLPLPGS